MPETLQLSLILAMFIAVALLSALARRIGAASPAVMLIAGVAIAFLPGVPAITLAPELVLLAFLPPLIYSSGVGMSWRGFRSNSLQILLLAIGCVLFSASAVAAVGHYGLGLSWPIGFVLGAIVSPPDAVAAMAVLRRMRLPRRLLTILEGESLINDATALVTLTFALEAAATGQFSPALAIGKFLAIVFGEIAFGVAVGFVMLRLRHLVNETRAEVLLALATPFVAFWPPHELGGSGVVACVAAGLYVSWNGRNFIRSATRLQGFFIWDLVNWCIEALAFLVTGLQTKVVISSLASEGWPQLLIAGALVSVTVIVVRFVWVFPVTYLPRLLWPPLRRRQPAPNWRPPFLVGFAGLRGAVSLAAALSVPFTLRDAPFPHRDLILFATLSVIFATLIVQGGTISWLVRWLGLGRVGAREAAANRRAEEKARVEAIDSVLKVIDSIEAEASVSRSALEASRRWHNERRVNLAAGVEDDNPAAGMAALRLKLMTEERAAISRAYEANKITDEARRRIEREFDLEEARIRNAIAAASEAA